MLPENLDRLTRIHHNLRFMDRVVDFDYGETNILWDVDVIEAEAELQPNLEVDMFDFEEEEEDYKMKNKMYYKANAQTRKRRCFPLHERHGCLVSGRYGVG